MLLCFHVCVFFFFADFSYFVVKFLFYLNNSFFFSFYATATTVIYSLALLDALPISPLLTLLDTRVTRMPSSAWLAPVELRWVDVDRKGTRLNGRVNANVVIYKKNNKMKLDKQKEIDAMKKNTQNRIDGHKSEISR